MFKNITISLFAVLIVISLAFYLIPQTKVKKTVIATCPTYYELAKRLDSEKYQIITTASTGQSIELVENRQADFALSGRTLKPNEQQMEKIVIGEGYSFIGDEEITIYSDELKKYAIYTDLDLELIENNFFLGKIEKVDNVYDYLGQGIIITSWGNTDYTRAQIVHVLERNGERLRLSRQPTLYCPNACNREAQELALLIK